MAILEINEIKDTEIMDIESIDIESTDTEKVTRKIFIYRIRKKEKCTVREATNIYDTFMEVLSEELLKGNSVLLKNFGRFYVDTHKGQGSGFDSNKKKMEDYLVLKFYAAHSFSKVLRSEEHLALCDDNSDEE